MKTRFFDFIDSYVHADAVAEQWITGKITHIGSAKIGENVQAQVSLRDVSLMDTAAQLIASIKISDPKTFPISYKLQYNPSDIKSGHTYALSAMITGSGDKLLYINDFRTIAPLIEIPSPTVDIAVIRGTHTGITSSHTFDYFSWRTP